MRGWPSTSRWTASAGLVRARVTDYDVIVLDRDLPVVHGDRVCRQLVAAGGRSRVLMLTGAAENEDLVDGLGLGADDYLPKPFAFAVLVARIGALARRAQPSIPPVLEHDDIVLDTAQRIAHRAGKTAGAAAQGIRGARAAAQRPGPGRLSPRSCSNASGMRPPTRSRARSRSRSAACGPSSVTLPVIETIAKAGYRI